MPCLPACPRTCQGSKAAPRGLRDDSDFAPKEQKQRAARQSKQHASAVSPGEEDLEVAPGVIGAVLGGGASSRSGRQRRVAVKLMGAMSAAEQWRYSHQHAAEASQLEEDKMAGQQHAAGQGKAPARKRRSRGQNSSGTGQQACGQAAAEHAGHTEQQEGSGDESGGLPVDYRRKGTEMTKTSHLSPL
jgi:hypothetical protein